jgi:hypothetical protein
MARKIEDDGFFFSLIIIYYSISALFETAISKLNIEDRIKHKILLIIYLYTH